MLTEALSKNDAREKYAVAWALYDDIVVTSLSLMAYILIVLLAYWTWTLAPSVTWVR